VSPPDRTPDWSLWLLAAAALAIGAYATWHYHTVGLTLSHYDAKAHLVVARRVIDSLTPGWKQIGAVWLPLPPLINLLPVQIDWCYRTGASAILLSMLSFSLLAYAAARIVFVATGSRLAAAAGVSVLALNPDLLYLQATPMTEPLLLGLEVLAVAFLQEWVLIDGTERAMKPGLVLALAALTRYEAWPVTAAVLALTGLALLRRGVPFGAAVRRVGSVALFPMAAMAMFFVQSRLTMGRWFVTDGFYVPDNPDTGRPFKTIGSIWWASHHLNGYPALLCATAGAIAVAVMAVRSRQRTATVVVLGLVAAAALPWYAFVIGHPFRFRYMVPLVPAVGVCAGIGAGWMGRWRTAASVALLALVVIGARPLSSTAPMVIEAQLDREHSQQRQAVAAYLRTHRNGGPILASLGSLSHFVHELSRDGVHIRDVVHEGNGDLWAAALEKPDAHVEWIIIEELARGGDRLAERARQDPAFLRGFTRVAEGGGVALYERRLRR
jgi:hypothetical protein